MKLRHLILFLTVVGIPLICPANEASAADITPHYKKGQSHQYGGILDLTLTQKIVNPQTCDLKYHVVLKSDLKIDVTEVYDNKSADLLIHFMDPALQFSLNCDMQNAMSFDLTFDSTKDEPGQMKEMQIAKSLIDCLNGVQFLIKVSEKGEILGVKGIEPIQQKIAEQMGESPLLQSSGEGLCALLTEDRVSKIASYFTLYLPSGPVKKGDAWNKTFNFFSNQVSQNWSFKDEDSQVITLTEKSTIQEGPLKSESGTTIFEKFSGDLTETLTLEKGTYWFSSHQAEFNSEATQTINFPMNDEPAHIQYQISGKSDFKKK
ncbi:MAG: hypothetical protein K940chlam3_01764 [Chlamydiae bacterium]|nr:hypothetical protein [Chlamydiota bacterium]